MNTFQYPGMVGDFVPIIRNKGKISGSKSFLYFLLMSISFSPIGMPHCVAQSLTA